MLCRRCRKPLFSRRSIKRRHGAKCWAHEKRELAIAAQGDLFSGWLAWDAYRKRRGGRHRSTAT